MSFPRSPEYMATLAAINDANRLGAKPQPEKPQRAHLVYTGPYVIYGGALGEHIARERAKLSSGIPGDPNAIVKYPGQPAPAPAPAALSPTITDRPSLAKALGCNEDLAEILAAVLALRGGDANAGDSQLRRAVSSAALKSRTLPPTTNRTRLVR
jgi:hypothetical protein